MRLNIDKGTRNAIEELAGGRAEGPRVMHERGTLSYYRRCHRILAQVSKPRRRCMETGRLILSLCVRVI